MGTVQVSRLIRDGNDWWEVERNPPSHFDYTHSALKRLLGSILGDRIECSAQLYTWHRGSNGNR